jgi:hypothetical protein
MSPVVNAEKLPIDGFHLVVGISLLFALLWILALVSEQKENRLKIVITDTLI